MKRSEMIQKINNYFCSLLWKDVPLEPDGSWDSHKNAEDILDLVENLGMLPPNVCGSGRDFDDKAYAAHYHMGKDPYYWEKE
jgi:hypothetical protein